MITTINELADDRLAIGGNNPPPETLAELLVEESLALKLRADELIAGAQRAVVHDRDTAERAVLLVRMMTEHGAAIDKQRVERKAPYLEGCHTIDRHFQALRADLVGADPKRLGGEALRVNGLVDGFYAAEEAKAEAERQRLQEAAKKAQEEAEAAERVRVAAEEQARQAARQGDVAAAVAQGTARVDAELRQRQAQAEAERLTKQAAETKVAPINTGLGITAFRRSAWSFKITDLTLAMRYARKLNEPALREVVQQIYDRQARAGVRSLPGAEIVEDRSTRIRRP